MKISLVLMFAGAMSASVLAQDQNKPLADAFEKRVKDYVKLRENIEAKMPKLSKEAKAEEIETHKKQLQESVRTSRAGAKHGDSPTGIDLAGPISDRSDSVASVIGPATGPWGPNAPGGGDAGRHPLHADAGRDRV